MAVASVRTCALNPINWAGSIVPLVVYPSVFPSNKCVTVYKACAFASNLRKRFISRTCALAATA
jgi:hypothetical protein